MSIVACGYASRSALITGSVRMKSPIAPPRITRMRFNSILSERVGEDRDAVERRDAVNGVPARVCLRAPTNLIAQQIGHRHPKQTGDDHQIGENGEKQPAGFVTKERGFEQRFSGEQTKHAQSASCEKFLHKSDDEQVTDRQYD